MNLTCGGGHTHEAVCQGVFYCEETHSLYIELRKFTEESGLVRGQLPPRLVVACIVESFVASYPRYRLHQVVIL